MNVGEYMGDRFAGIDPGSHVSGLVIFDDVDASPDPYLISDGVALPVASFELVTLERMQARGAVPPQDLIDVQCTGAYIAGLLRPRDLRLMTAQEWKGSLKKEITDLRLQGWLAERGQLAEFRDKLADLPKAHHKECWDALGIALVGRGILQKGCVK